MKLETRFFAAEYVDAELLAKFREAEKDAWNTVAAPAEWGEKDFRDLLENVLYPLQFRQQRLDDAARDLRSNYGRHTESDAIMQQIAEEQSRRAGFEAYIFQRAEEHDGPVFNPIGRTWNDDGLQNLRRQTSDDDAMRAKGLDGLTTMRDNLRRYRDNQRARYEVSLDLFGHNAPESNAERDALHAIDRAFNRTDSPYREVESEDREARREAQAAADDQERKTLTQQIRQGTSDTAAAKARLAELNARRGPGDLPIAYDAHGNRLPQPEGV